MEPTGTKMEEAAASSRESRGFLSDLVLNAFEPGVNNAVLIFLNIIFFFLLATLVAVTFVTGINIHVIFLGILALGLMIGFNVFITQLPRTDPDDKSACDDDSKKTQ